MKKQIAKAISSVIDPEVGFDILALGLIYDIDFKDNTAYITMTLSTKSCPMHEMLIMWVKNAVNAVEGVKYTDINLTFEPAWNIEMADDSVKNALL